MVYARICPQSGNFCSHDLHTRSASTRMVRKIESTVKLPNWHEQEFINIVERLHLLNDSKPREGTAASTLPGKFTRILYAAPPLSFVRLLLWTNSTVNLNLLLTYLICT